LYGTKVRPRDHHPRYCHSCEDRVIEDAPDFPVAKCVGDGVLELIHSESVSDAELLLSSTLLCKADMPSPIEGATVGNQKLQAFQENVDTMATRAVKLPWQETPQGVKARIEG